MLYISKSCRYSDEVLQKLARWTYTPRICTLAGAFCLSVSALAGYFLGVERRIALVGSAVIGTGVVLTAVSTIAVLSAFRQFSQRRPVDHSVGGSNEQCRNDPSIDTEEAGVTMRKEEHGDGFVLEPARSHSCLTPLSSLSTSAGLSFRSPRLHS